MCNIELEVSLPACQVLITFTGYLGLPRNKVWGLHLCSLCLSLIMLSQPPGSVSSIKQGHLIWLSLVWLEFLAPVERFFLTLCSQVKEQDWKFYQCFRCRHSRFGSCTVIFCLQVFHCGSWGPYYRRHMFLSVISLVSQLSTQEFLQGHLTVHKGTRLFSLWIKKAF